MSKAAYRRIFYILQFIRLFAPLAIFINVFLGIAMATFFDLIDAMFASGGGMRRHQYHSWDKGQLLVRNFLSLCIVDT